VESADAVIDSVKRLPVVRGEAARNIIANAGSLIGTSAVVTALGFPYWWVAAHYFSAAAVGVASASISAMGLLASFSTLGLGTLLMGEVPRRIGRAGSLIVTALLASAIAGTLIGAVFAAVVGTASSDLHALGQSVASVALFAVGVGLTSSTSVLDSGLIGLLRGDLQLARNVTHSLAKLAIVAAIGLWVEDKTGLSILGSWVGGIVISLIVLTAMFVIKGIRIRTLLLPGLDLDPRLAWTALSHHVTNIALFVTPLALPVLATQLLSARIGAYFYVAWLLMSTAAYPAYAFSTVLYAAGSADASSLPAKARLTLGLSLVISVLAATVLAVGADSILSVFGSAYAHYAALPLRLMVLGIFGLMIKDHFVAISRVNLQLSRAMFIVGPGTILELCLASVGALLGGIGGLVLGWLAALLIQALVMFPLIYRTVTAGVENAPQPARELEAR
jgi:O-antigen/teichoic acid export membrane protein